MFSVRDISVERELFTQWPVIARVFWLFGYDAVVLDSEPDSTKWRTWANDRGDQMAMNLKDRIAQEIERDCPNIRAEAKETHIHTELR